MTYWYCIGTGLLQPRSFPEYSGPASSSPTGVYEGEEFVSKRKTQRANIPGHQEVAGYGSIEVTHGIESELVLGDSLDLQVEPRERRRGEQWLREAKSDVTPPTG